MRGLFVILWKTITMEKLRFDDFDEAKSYFRLLGYDYYALILARKGIDVKTMFKLGVEN